MASNEDTPVSIALNVNDPKLGLMLSYSHEDEEIVNKIKDRLRRQGYDVWIDSEKMVGPLTPAMAEAVSDAGIVITCLSKKYEESPNCKFEYECMLELNKPFVALIMEDFKMDKGSWLKDFKENLFVNFTDEASFEGNFSELTRVLNLTKDKILKAHIRSQQVPPQGGSGGASSSQQQPEGGGSGGASSSQQQPEGGGSGGASSSQQHPEGGGSGGASSSQQQPEGGSGGAPSSQQQPAGDDVEDRLLNVVSEWWEEYGRIDMLKILLHQFVPKVGRAEIERAKDVRSLFRILKGIGEFNRPYHVIVFEAVMICGLEGVQVEINKIEGFQEFKFEDVAYHCRLFSNFYRNMIVFGKHLDEESIRNIGKICNIGEDVHNDNEWLLILALMKKNVTGNMAHFIKLLHENGMGEEADVLENLYF